MCNVNKSLAAYPLHAFVVFNMDERAFYFKPHRRNKKLNIRDLNLCV